MSQKRLTPSDQSGRITRIGITEQLPSFSRRCERRRSGGAIESPAVLIRIDIWDVPPGWPVKVILAWSLPLPLFVLLVAEWRFRRQRGKANFEC